MYMSDATTLIFSKLLLLAGTACMLRCVEQRVWWFPRPLLNWLCWFAQHCLVQAMPFLLCLLIPAGTGCCVTAVVTASPPGGVPCHGWSGFHPSHPWQGTPLFGHSTTVVMPSVHSFLITSTVEVRSASTLAY
jgi:hypothetical protein